MTTPENVISPSLDDVWTLVEAEMGQSPCWIRYRASLKKVLGHPAYPYCLNVAWEYGDEEDAQMPGNTELAAMEEFGNALEAALDPDGLGVLAFIITFRGSREWMFYVANPEAVEERINGVFQGQEDLPIQLEISNDPSWSELRFWFEKLPTDA